MHLDELIAWHRKDEIRDTTISNIFDLLSDYGQTPEDLKEQVVAKDEKLNKIGYDAYLEQM